MNGFIPINKILKKEHEIFDFDIVLNIKDLVNFEKHIDHLYKCGIERHLKMNNSQKKRKRKFD